MPDRSIPAVPINLGDGGARLWATMVSVHHDLTPDELLTLEECAHRWDQIERGRTDSAGSGIVYTRASARHPGLI
jgi:hypothetical protein